MQADQPKQPVEPRQSPFADWTKALGQRAYEAYVRQAGGVSMVNGKQLPTWDQLCPRTQTCWVKASTEVSALLCRMMAFSMGQFSHGLSVQADREAILTAAKDVGFRYETAKPAADKD